MKGGKKMAAAAYAKKGKGVKSKGMLTKPSAQTMMARMNGKK